jgi:hypothetical protein
MVPTLLQTAGKSDGFCIWIAVQIRAMGSRLPGTESLADKRFARPLPRLILDYQRGIDCDDSSFALMCPNEPQYFVGALER